MTVSKHPGAEVAGKYEIIERIMLHLPRRDLARAWLVNKAFKDVFTTSQEVKKKLRMDFPHGKTVYLNTLPTAPFGAMRLQWTGRSLCLLIFGFLGVRAIRSNKSTLSPAGWRLIPLFLPEAESAYCKCPGSHGTHLSWSCKTAFSLSGFVTMGQLSDTLLEFAEKHELQDSVRLIQVFYHNPKDSESQQN